MLGLTSVISLPKLIQSTSMRPGFLRLEIIMSRLNQNQGSFSRIGAKLWNAIPNEFRQLSKGSFKKHFHDLLLSIMETEDDYVGSKCPFCYKKSLNLQPRRDSLIIDSSLVNFCKPIYVTLPCFFFVTLIFSA